MYLRKFSRQGTPLPLRSVLSFDINYIRNVMTPTFHQPLYKKNTFHRLNTVKWTEHWVSQCIMHAP